MSDKEPPPRLSDLELRQFVADWLDGKIFSDRHIANQEDILLSFMVLAFLDQETTTTDWNQVGLVYEHLSEAMQGRLVNGMPIFFSCRMMHIEDWQKAIPLIKAEQRRRAEFLGQSTEGLDNLDSNQLLLELPDGNGNEGTDQPVHDPDEEERD